MARAKQTPPKSFEDALAELEQILSDIEGGQVPLEQSLVMYERGQFLIGHCRGVLARAEKQIEVLGKSDGTGVPRVEEEDDEESEDVEERAVSDVVVEQLLAGHAATVDRHLASILAQVGRDASRLNESIAYSINAGGKRLRPALVLETFRACGGDVGDDDHPVHLAAAAIELVHTFSLVHDDLPAMDDDDLRRGKPTNHKVFGEATAILAGDAMLTMAFNTLAGYREPAIAARLVLELAGATEAMIAGQNLDIEGEKGALTLKQLQRVHERKTGALITTACRMGAVCAGVTDAQLDSLSAYGKHLGTAFQIVDDVLDVTSTPQELGKATRKDAGIGKNTYPRLLGLEGSRAAAAEHVRSALAALDEFAAAADGLRALARFVESRSR